MKIELNEEAMVAIIAVAVAAALIAMSISH
jgi:hypothetical protein